MLEETLTLIMRIPNDYEGLRIKASTAALLIMRFGPDAISFIDSIMDEWVEIAEIFGFNSYRATQLATARAAIWYWRWKIEPYCRKSGIPDQLRFMDYFEDDCTLLRLGAIDIEAQIEDASEGEVEI